MAQGEGKQNESLPDLGPILEPEAVSFSFNTLGWKITGGIITVVIIYSLLKWAIRYHQNAYRRAAASVLDQIETLFKNKKDPACLNDALVLLKQVAITAFGRTEAAHLSGSDWLRYLESKGKNTPFSLYEHDVLNSLYTKKMVDSDSTLKIIKLSKTWINTHA